MKILKKCIKMIKFDEVYLSTVGNTVSADFAGWKLIIKIKMSLQPQAQMLTSM